MGVRFPMKSPAQMKSPAIAGLFSIDRPGPEDQDW
jgi:hypothetical protein